MFAQNLVIPANMDNAAITIKQIFLSPTGIVRGDAASIAIDALDKEQAILRIGSNSVNGTLNTHVANVSNNLTVGGAVKFTHSALRCNVGQNPGGL